MFHFLYGITTQNKEDSNAGELIRKKTFIWQLESQTAQSESNLEYSYFIHIDHLY